MRRWACPWSWQTILRFPIYLLPSPYTHAQWKWLSEYFLFHFTCITMWVFRFPWQLRLLEYQRRNYSGLRAGLRAANINSLFLLLHNLTSSFSPWCKNSTWGEGVLDRKLWRDGQLLFWVSLMLYLFIANKTVFSFQGKAGKEYMGSGWIKMSSIQVSGWASEIGRVPGWTPPHSIHWLWVTLFLYSHICCDYNFSSRSDNCVNNYDN